MNLFSHTLTHSCACTLGFIRPSKCVYTLIYLSRITIVSEFSHLRPCHDQLNEVSKPLARYLFSLETKEVPSKKVAWNSLNHRQAIGVRNKLSALFLQMFRTHWFFSLDDDLETPAWRMLYPAFYLYIDDTYTWDRDFQSRKIAVIASDCHSWFWMHSFKPSTSL